MQSLPQSHSQECPNGRRCSTPPHRLVSTPPTSGGGESGRRTEPTSGSPPPRSGTVKMHANSTTYHDAILASMCQAHTQNAIMCPLDGVAKVCGIHVRPPSGTSPLVGDWRQSQRGGALYRNASTRCAVKRTYSNIVKRMTDHRLYNYH